MRDRGEAETLVVELGARSYPIRVGEGLDGFGPFVRGALEGSWAGRGCRSALVVVDANVRRLAVALVDSLGSQGITAEVAEVPPGEASKTLARASELYDRLVDLRADRHNCVVALGGGVVGDLAGFVAATYARGLPLVMVPTTLLAQVDSSVGGKVGVNHPRVKNIIGAFHQPSAVWVDTGSLASLPTRELRSGMAEVVKYGMILDAPFFAELERQAEPLLTLEATALRRTILRSCELKAGVVALDEREETGERAALNFGHTVGHAIEAVAGYDGPYRHGEAVAVGMVAECRLAERLGWIGPDVTERLLALLKRLGLPTRSPGLDRDALLAAMGRDKKNQGGSVRFVLPRELGRVELTDAARSEDLSACLGSIL